MPLTTPTPPSGGMSLGDGQSDLTKRLIREELRPKKAAGRWKYLPARFFRQLGVSQWCAKAFGSAHAASVAQRAVRMREEAEEAYQAAMHEAGFDPAEALALAHRQTDHVHSRPPGKLAQELGGVGVTTLALAHAAGLDADQCEVDEINRVLALPLEHFAKRNAEKNAAGFDVTGAYPGKDAAA
jgi:hypothetical protein